MTTKILAAVATLVLLGLGSLVHAQGASDNVFHPVRATIADRPGDAVTSDAAVSGSNVYFDREGAETGLWDMNDGSPDMYDFQLWMKHKREVRLIIPGIVNTSCARASLYLIAPDDPDFYHMAIGDTVFSGGVVECFEQSKRSGWRVEYLGCLEIRHPAAGAWSIAAEPTNQCSALVEKVERGNAAFADFLDVPFRIDATELE